MERQTSLPQPVLYEPDDSVLVSVGPDTSHEFIVVPVWESVTPNDDSCKLLLDEQVHLATLDKASLGALGAAIRVHSFTGKKVGCGCSSALCITIGMNCIQHAIIKTSAGTWTPWLHLEIQVRNLAYRCPVVSCSPAHWMYLLVLTAACCDALSCSHSTYHHKPCGIQLLDSSKAQFIGSRTPGITGQGLLCLCTGSNSATSAAA